MIADEQLGGAFVRRTFTRGGENMKPGTRLSRKDLLAFSLPNRRALISAGYIDPFPIGDKISGERQIVHVGKGMYNVYAGKLNAEPLTREQAEALASKPQN